MTQREDPLAQAERYVREAEERIGHQLEIIAELDRDGHDRMAAEARHLLAIFQQSLDLAHDHLLRERRERGHATFAAGLRFPRAFPFLEVRAVGEKSRGVLDAADMWLVAVETRELLGETASVLEELEEMEAKLADAVHAWRLSGGRESAFV